MIEKFTIIQSQDDRKKNAIIQNRMIERKTTMTSGHKKLKLELLRKKNSWGKKAF